MTATVKRLPGLADYGATWTTMRAFTEARTADTPDEIWLCEHAAVYTLGQAGKPEHLLNTHAIPVVQTDRGGQVTFHGPGQVVAYPLIDLRRANLFVKEYVRCLEDAALDVLADYGILDACLVAGAPGVYVPRSLGGYSKVAAVGLKVRQGCVYHGLALNVAMDLTPYLGINPCGMAGLSTLDMKTCLSDDTLSPVEVGNRLAARLKARIYRQDISSASLKGDAGLPPVQSRVHPNIQSTATAASIPSVPNLHA